MEYGAISFLRKKELKTLNHAVDIDISSLHFSLLNTKKNANKCFR